MLIILHEPSELSILEISSIIEVLEFQVFERVCAERRKTMVKRKQNNLVHCCNLFSVLLVVVAEVIHFPECVEAAGAPVKFLPGFQGPLPLELETGYIGVGDSDDVQLFYYFIKSESNPKSDPLILWLIGGPGCSSISGLLLEIGPITFEPAEYNGSFPSLVLNPHTWTKVVSFIFLDLPVGTGFSYARTSEARQSDDLQASDHAYQFLRKGYLLGNPATFHGEYNYRISYAHGVGLISDELFESLKRNCKGEYFDIHPRNTQCWNDRQTYDQMLGGITNAHILEPKCEFASPRPQKWIGQRRSLDEMLYLGRLRCRGSIGKWKRCAGDALPYQKIIGNSIPYHANLSVKGYRSLIYSGDHDTMIPYTSTEAWIRSLNYSIVDDWRPWIVDGQVAGYTRTYSNKMTFATGGGHTAPEYKPVECLAMLRRWLSYQPL
uniref:Serine carboxypeptidase n=1 Tax=Solanum tuberosum TaxID=4113 RepID=M1AZE1_SOLTU